jgi:hypothetical protein
MERSQFPLASLPGIGSTRPCAIYRFGYSGNASPPSSFASKHFLLVGDLMLAKSAAHQRGAMSADSDTSVEEA